VILDDAIAEHNPSHWQITIITEAFSANATILGFITHTQNGCDLSAEATAIQSDGGSGVERATASTIREVRCGSTVAGRRAASGGRRAGRGWL
jgi:hypothetical protein